MKIEDVDKYQGYFSGCVEMLFKGIVSPDWKGLHMFALDRFEV
jgi:hypothetical protein